VARIRNERGFMMLELLMAMTVMAIALTALIVVFTLGLFTMRHSSQVTTAAALADAQMETFRAMTSRDIGIDLTAGTVNALDSTYTNDVACANPTASPATTCAVNGVASTEVGPTGASPHSCTTINTWYPNTDPCTPSRTVSSATTPASPDGRSYRVDTYVVAVAATSSGTLQRASKQVTVVVRDSSNLAHVFARETSVFDCSTGITPGSTDC
jgi:type II secretory pathway pseudopilin PulG